MGNKQIKETINKHQILSEKLKNDKLDKNLIIFNMPIIINGYRRSKSYIDQITEASNEELNNTTYNSLYLSGLGIKISNSDVKFIKNDELSSWTNPEENIEVLQTVDEFHNPIRIFKHFDWNDDPIPEIISTHVENIIKLKNVKKEIENLIWEEKLKIIQLEYVQSKLNKPIGETNEYIQTVKYLDESIDKRLKK